jgi:hypothetical protein
MDKALDGGVQQVLLTLHGNPLYAATPCRALQHAAHTPRCSLRLGTLRHTKAP